MDVPGVVSDLDFQAGLREKTLVRRRRDRKTVLISLHCGEVTMLSPLCNPLLLRDFVVVSVEVHASKVRHLDSRYLSTGRHASVVRHLEADMFVLTEVDDLSDVMKGGS